MDAEKNVFDARGGWWVLAQVPVMLGAFVVPLAWGAASIDFANAMQVAGAVLSLTGLLVALAVLGGAGIAVRRSSMTATRNPH